MLAWIRLFRLALAPTILWDVTAGFLFAEALIQNNKAIARQSFESEATVSSWQWAGPQLALTGAILLAVFHAGMALNDWADRRIDKEAQRKRPLVDGTIKPKSALLAALLMLGAAAAAAFWVHPEPIWILALCGLVMAYDLGGSAVRSGLGPLLLALCRTISFSSGLLLLLSPQAAANSQAPWGIASYALYVLFLARLAAKEEDGGPGMNMLPPIVLMCLSPFPLTQLESEQTLWLHLAWLGFAVWHLLPALPDRHIIWHPLRVQAGVRRALVAMPALPAMVLIAADAPLWQAAIGVAVAAITVQLARRLAPE